VATLRGRALLAANPEAVSLAPALLTFGLLSLLLAALTLRRQRGPELLAVASVGQVGVVAFAFGLGTEAATAAGVLHLTMLTLVRAAVVLRPGFVVGLLALAGLPPFGLFGSLFLIVTETTRRAPWLAVPLVLGLAGCAWALVGRAAPHWRQPAAPGVAARVAWLLVGLSAIVGLAMPGPAGAWFGGIARALR
jgi:hydrogenase-4 component F